VLTVAFDWDALCARICVHAFPADTLDAPPRLTLALPRLRVPPAAAEVFVRLHEDHAPWDGQGHFHPDPADRALFVSALLIGADARRPVRGALFCIPLGAVREHVAESAALSDEAEFEVPWHEWGPLACGVVPAAPPLLGVACFGMRAALCVADAGARGEVEFEVLDFHPGRVSLARAAKQDRAAGWFRVQASEELDGKLWDEEDVMTTPGLEYVVSRRRVPDPGATQGHAVLTEDALLYMPVRVFFCIALFFGMLISSRRSATLSRASRPSTKLSYSELVIITRLRSNPCTVMYSPQRDVKVSPSDHI
jgi:hypothetical protein